MQLVKINSSKGMIVQYHKKELHHQTEDAILI
jgi:hypothetical protein